MRVRTMMLLMVGFCAAGLAASVWVSAMQLARLSDESLLRTHVVGALVALVLAVGGHSWFGVFFLVARRSLEGVGGVGLAAGISWLAALMLGAAFALGVTAFTGDGGAGAHRAVAWAALLLQGVAMVVQMRWVNRVHSLETEARAELD